MNRISKNHNNQIDSLKEIHSNEVGSIHADYERKIEDLNHEKAELEDKISLMQTQAQIDYNEMMHKHDEQLYLIQQEANSENDRLFNENENLRSEIEQLKSKSSS